MIQPEVMAPPLVWLVSDAAGRITGRRFLAVHWDTKLPPEEAGREGWSTGRVDKHCDNAHYAKPLLTDFSQFRRKLADYRPG
jgi:hypothetical protein